MTETTRQTQSGLVLVLGATILSAASSFIVLLIVAPALGPADYAKFSVYWSALFMVVAVLFGLQQESTRGVAERRSATPNSDIGSPQQEPPEQAVPRPRKHPRTSVITFALVIAATLLVVLGTTSAAWSEFLFGTGTQSWGVPFAVAVATYALVAATNGILAGTGRWGAFSLLAVIDGALRLALVALVLGFGLDSTALAWAVALPFPVSLAIVFLGNRRALFENATINESTSTLAANAARTLTASVASAILINGFPVFLSMFSRTNDATLGAVILAVTLTRAPILVPLTALQSMLIAHLSGAPGKRKRTLPIVFGFIAALTAGVAVFVWAWGAPLIGFLFGDGFVLSPSTLIGLVIASGCLGALTVSGAAVLSMKRHNLFSAGWLLSAGVAIGLLAFLPISLEARVVLALVIGPLVGILVHLVGMPRSRPPHTEAS